MDQTFGPTIVFGQGGTAVELIADRALALPPLNARLARELIARTRKAFVDWQAEVLYSGPDGDGSVIVNDKGTPFRVSTEIGSTAYKYEGQGKARREPFWDRGISVC